MQTELNKPRRRPAGFTLIELLVVIAILGILGSVAVVRLMKNPDKARVAKVIVDVKNLQLQADSFQLDKGRPISSLQELVPDYVEQLPKDPWGGDYAVEQRPDGTVKISCPNPKFLAAKQAMEGGMERHDGAIGAGAGSP